MLSGWIFFFPSYLKARLNSFELFWMVESSKNSGLDAHVLSDLNPKTKRAQSIDRKMLNVWKDENNWSPQKYLLMKWIHYKNYLHYKSCLRNKSCPHYKSCLHQYSYNKSTARSHSLASILNEPTVWLGLTTITCWSSRRTIRADSHEHFSPLENHLWPQEATKF